MTDKEIMEAFLKGETLTWDGLQYVLGDDGNVKAPHIPNLFRGDWRIKTKPRLTWDQALQAMREGKKVRRKGWCFFWHIHASGRLSTGDEDNVRIDVCDFDATDFEVVE